MIFLRRTRKPDCCCVCGRRACWRPLDGQVVVMELKRSAAFWLCADTRCADTISELIDMDDELRDVVELHAIGDGGEAGGSYLDEIGETDLAKLTEDQFRTFVARVLAGYAAGVRRQAMKVEIPF